MAKKARKTVLAQAKEMVAEQVEAIDERLETLNKRMAVYDKVKEERDKLISARRALLGGTRATGSGGTQVRQEDIVRYLRENPGSAPGQIAQHLGATQTVVSSHLYRGKNERFLSKDGRWYLREPKKGINTEEDIEDE